MRKIPGHAPVLTPSRDATYVDVLEDNSICPQEKDNSSNYFTFAKYMRHLLVTWKLTQ